MKRIFAALAFVSLMAISCDSNAQKDKSKRPSPPAKVTQTLKGGTVVTIDYSQPAVKGREIGKDVEPMEGKVWRTGANEATVFEVSKDVRVNGLALPAGKYGLYTIKNGAEWTIIFSKKWDTWGTNYSESDDALRIKTKTAKQSTPSERMTFTIDEKGTVTLAWGNTGFYFFVEE